MNTRAWPRILRLLTLVRIAAYDTSTPDGRAKERYRRAALHALTGGAARAATICAALLVVPLTINYLGAERYGMWLTLSSVFSFAFVADLGITTGLQLALGRLDAAEDREAARRYVSSAFAILITTSSVGAVVLIVVYAAVDWADVFNVTSPAAIAEAPSGALVFGATWLVNVVAAAVWRIHYGYQQGYVSHLWQILGSVLSVTAAALVIRAEGGLSALIIAVVGVPAIAMILNAIQLFGVRMPWLRPSIRDVDGSVVKALLHDGKWYLLAGLSYYLVQIIYNLGIAHWVNPRAVAEFGVPFRVTAVLNLVFASIFNALLPAYTEAVARGESRWVVAALARSLSITLLIGAVGGAGLVLTGKHVIELWVGDAVQPSYPLLLGLAAWAVISGVASGINSFVQAAGGVRANAIQWISAAALTVPTQYLAIVHAGIDGVPWALAAVEVTCRLIPGIVYYRRWITLQEKGS